MDEAQVSRLSEQLEKSLDALRRARFDSAAEPGIRGPERFMLFMIGSLRDGAPVMPSEIAKHMGVTSAAISHHLNSLEEKGCVVRSLSQDDKRVSYVSLSPEGEAMLRRFKDQMRTKVRGLVEHLGESDSQSLVSLLAKIGAYMGRETR